MVKPSDVYANPAIARAKAVTAATARIEEHFHEVDEEFNAIIRLMREDKRSEEEIAKVLAMQTTFREVSRYNVPEFKTKWSQHVDFLNRNRV